MSKLNFRRYKKKLFHKSTNHGGWNKYKSEMKKCGFWN